MTISKVLSSVETYQVLPIATPPKSILTASQCKLMGLDIVSCTTVPSIFNSNIGPSGRINISSNLLQKTKRWANLTVSTHPVISYGKVNKKCIHISTFPLVLCTKQIVIVIGWVKFPSPEVKEVVNIMNSLVSPMIINTVHQALVYVYITDLVWWKTSCCPWSYKHFGLCS